MGNFSKVLRILIAIHFGIGGIALFFVLPSLGGMTDTEKVLTIVGLVLVVVIFIYNLICLIRDENIIWEAISNGRDTSSGGFFAKVGRFLLVIPKGIWWVVCGIVFLIIWPFRKIYKIFRYGIGHKIKIAKENKKEKQVKEKPTKEKKTKPQKIKLNKDAVNQYKAEIEKFLGREISQEEAEFEYTLRQKDAIERKKREKEQEKQKKELEKKQKEQKKKELELQKKAEKVESKLTNEERKEFDALKKKIEYDVGDYIKSIGLAEADAKVGLEYSDSIDNLRKFIVTWFNSSGVTDVSASAMFNRKTRKFIGSEKWPYINTNYDENSDSELNTLKKKLAYYVKEAEEKGALSPKLHIQNYDMSQRIIESSIGSSKVDIEKALAKKLGIEWQEAKKLVDENGNLLGSAMHFEEIGDIKKARDSFKNSKKKLVEFKKLREEYTAARNYYEDSNTSHERVDRLEPYNSARSKLDVLCKDVRKELLNNVRDSYKNTFYTCGREIAESAFVLACKKLDKNPKDVAKVLEISCSGITDGEED